MDMDNDIDSTYSSSEDDSQLSSDLSMNDGDHEPSVTFKCIDSEEVEEKMKSSIDYIKQITKMPNKTAALCLRLYGWDQDRLLEHFVEKTQKQFYDYLKVISPSHTKTGKRKRTSICGICFDSFSTLKTAEIGCGHRFCKECWRLYIEQKIISDGADIIQCPEHQCLISIDDDFVEKIIPKQNVIAQYNRFILNSFVKHSKTLNFCPAPGCALFIAASSTPMFELSCECNCGHKFCFECFQMPHDQIPCVIMRAWEEKDHLKTAVYLVKKAKRCPKCDVLVEKISGCDHMVCTLCKQHFCWRCCKKTHKDYSHACDETAKKSGIQSFEKFMRYHKQFETYHNSLENERDYRNSMLRKGVAELSLSHQNVVKKGIDSLFLCHRRLMTSYMFVYYLEEGILKEVFESNQRRLVEAAKNMQLHLEEFLALSSDAVLAKLMNEIQICYARQKDIHNHITELYIQNMWLLGNKA